jgi:hypothetical protein
MATGHAELHLLAVSALATLWQAAVLVWPAPAQRFQVFNMRVRHKRTLRKCVECYMQQRTLWDVGKGLTSIPGSLHMGSATQCMPCRHQSHNIAGGQNRTSSTGCAQLQDQRDAALPGAATQVTPLPTWPESICCQSVHSCHLHLTPPLVMKPEAPAKNRQQLSGQPLTLRR